MERGGPVPRWPFGEVASQPSLCLLIQAAGRIGYDKRSVSSTPRRLSPFLWTSPPAVKLKSMSSHTSQLLEAFDALPVEEQREFTAAFLRRAIPSDSGPL